MKIKIAKELVAKGFDKDMVADAVMSKPEKTETQEERKLNKEAIELLEIEIVKLKEELQRLENNENTDEYDDMLDDCNPEIKIGTLRYSPSHVLKNVDEIAYNCGMNEYNDEKMSELEDEIKGKEQELKELKAEEKQEITT
jgi:hypothetical protein